jgi:hypothetical protein
MARAAMRARHSVVVATSLFAALLLLLALGIAVDARLSAIWRVALESVDDPAGQEHDEATTADVPLVHRGGEASARVAAALTTLARLTPTSDSAVSRAVRVVSGSRAPPTA